MSGGLPAPDYVPLHKILDLEIKKGYADTAVIGGLSKFLSNWLSGNRIPAGLRKMLSIDYAGLDREQRKIWIVKILSFIEKPEPIRKTAPRPKILPKIPERRNVRSSTEVKTGSLELPVTSLKGISTTLAGKFNKMGVQTIRDMLYFFPHRHIDYTRNKKISELVPGEEQTVVANVWEARITRPGNRPSTEITAGDETGNIRAIWFNNPYLARQLKVNTRVALSGKVNIFKGHYVFESPDWEIIEDEEQESIHTGRLVPVYPLTAGLHPRQARKLVKQAVDDYASRVTDFLPQSIKQSCGLIDLPEAIIQSHYPVDNMIKDHARTRLAFDELFLLQLGVLGKKRDWHLSAPSIPLLKNNNVLNSFKNSLPFKLTGAQDKALNEILTDISRPQAMSRLLQGDVGSGKTVVATAALLTAVANGKQGALMAPTEILAEQHFSTICQILSRSGAIVENQADIKVFQGILSQPLTVVLLTGSLSASRKKFIRELVEQGTANIVIGTHAIIQKDVYFKNLALAVIDEQHRFGVEQRSALRQKGFNPHILVMTATPIPRTLALTLYGDLDLSVIDELPPGRQAIKTKWLNPEQREMAYHFIHQQIAQGRQAFVLCPLIEESEAVQAKAAAEEYNRLASIVFPDLKLGLLHGRISGKEKDSVMRQFHAGHFQVLVATPVIEVGIDVPNASVMLVESADRFGLSQLHQFRGRVGRGTEQSYCMLLAESPSEVGKKRLKIIETVQNGFVLAEEDLKLRGPGEFFGTRQSGIPDLKMARLSDTSLLECARSQAIKLFEVDPDLKQSEHAALAGELQRTWKPKNTGEMS